MGSEHNDPNPNCSYCSKRCIYLMLECNFTTTTYGEVDTVLRNYLSYGRNMQVKYAQPPKIGNIGTVEIKDYKDQLLTFNP